MAIWPANGSSLPLDRRFLLIEAFLEKSASCIARECRPKPKNRENISYKPEMKSQEPGQIDRRTGRQKDRLL